MAISRAWASSTSAGYVALVALTCSSWARMCSATRTSPLAKRSGLQYGMAKGIASIRLIFIGSP
ncbi:hypothetical protein [Nocardioides sp. AE5]|uniref:hypothetical protein n=1 Tax=Nocardioides sp. AE5 TaxID=2962573 RepID=UPI0028826125|nr:hypothetical protein [Nocardioides sp. AE5]MDT0200730.1 hypothetical protein [Nocardioides sp. AE5]